MIHHTVINIINKIILILFSIYVLIFGSIYITSISENVYKIVDTLILNDKTMIQLDMLSDKL